MLPIDSLVVDKTEDRTEHVLKPFVDWVKEDGFVLQKNFDRETQEWFTGGRLQLYSHQERIFGHVLTPDSNGYLPYGLFVYSDVKKSGKTTLEAAVSAWGAECYPPYSEIYFVANSKEHAQSRGYSMLTSHLVSRDIVQFKDNVQYPNGSAIVVLSTSYATAAGGDPAMSLWDELWAYETEDRRKLWAEMTFPPTQKNPLKAIFTYAGYKAQSKLLWEIYEDVVLNGEPVPELIDIVDDKGRPVCWRRGRSFVYWNTVPRMPWQTPEYYKQEQESAHIRPQEFLRLHRNQWASSEDPFAPIEWFDQAVERGKEVGLTAPATMLPEEPFIGYPMVFACDAGQKYDNTAIVGVYWDMKRGKVGIGYHKIWKPKPDEMFDFDKTVGAEFIKLKKKGMIIPLIVYDPRFLHQTMVRLKKKGFRTLEVQQTNKNLSLFSQALYDALQHGTLEAYPAPDLREHLEFAQAKQTESGFRIYKDKNATYDDDGAVALSMAVYYAIERGGHNNDRTLRVEMPFGDRSQMRHKTRQQEEEEKFLPPELRS